MNCLSECQIPAVTSISLSVMKPEISRSPEEGEYRNKNAEGNLKQLAMTIRRRRGKRKKDSCDKGAKDDSIARSDNLGSTNAALTTSRCNETSASECNQALVSSGPDDRSRDLCTVKNGDDLMEIFTSIAQNELGTVFRHWLDSQKRARYKKMIKQHLDFGTLRSRLVDGSIKSVKELFWDLFLLANNALVFYSKRTREYKSAFSLRGIVKKAYRQHCENSYNKATSRFLSLSQCCRYAFLSNPPSKPRSARPCPHPRPCIDEPSLKFQCTNETGETPGENEKLVDSIPLRYLLVAKKSLKHGANVKGASSRNSR
ncbi:hypothetical protein LIER_26664 [Lithospermum erythrorhizon]|uniref:Bromo domain-containing protein n=1 Tax=Lithospermum erythrorhizon TaxID=34254 RepID=A0AAV3RCU4_LITER